MPSAWPVAEFVVVGRNGEDHAHVERLAFGTILFNDRLEVVRLDRVHGFAVGTFRDVLLHLFPDFIGNGDAVAVQIHRESGNDMSLGTEADGRTERLTGQHVCAVQFPGDDAVEQDFPVGLRLESYVKSFVFEKAFFIGNCQRSHVGQFDEAELQLFLLQVQHCRFGGHTDGAQSYCGGRAQPYKGAAGKGLQKTVRCLTFTHSVPPKVHQNKTPPIRRSSPAPESAALQSSPTIGRNM